MILLLEDDEAGVAEGAIVSVDDGYSIGAIDVEEVCEYCPAGAELGVYDGEVAGTIDVELGAGCNAAEDVLGRLEYAPDNMLVADALEKEG